MGTLWWGHWGMSFGSGLQRTLTPAQGPVLLRSLLSQMGEVKAAAPGRPQVCGNVSLSKSPWLARNLTTLFSIKKHFPLKNRHKLEAGVKAPFQSVVTMAPFSSPDASVEISTSACMVLIKAAK